MQHSMFDVVVVGNMAFDVNVFPSRDNGRDMTVVNVGGAGFYSLLPAALFSDRVGIVARVGEDFPLERVSALGVDISGFQVMSGAKTTRFYHTYLSEDGQQRSFRPEVTRETLIVPEDIPRKYCESRRIHVATNFPKTQIACIERLRRSSRAKISIDTHEAYMAESLEEVLRAFDMVDIAFIDEHAKTLVSACKAPLRVIKRGKAGITLISKAGQLDIPAEPCDVVDKTGAGDVLAGVFLALTARGVTVEEAGRKAVEVASASVSGYGIEFLAGHYGREPGGNDERKLPGAT